MSADSEIIVQITAQTDQLKAGMQEASASVASAAAQMQAEMDALAAATQASAAEAASSVAAQAIAFNAAVSAKIEAQKRVNAAFRAGVADAAGMAEAESALDAAMAAGAFTAQEYKRRLAQLGDAEVGVATTAAAATGSLGLETAAVEVQSVALKSNSRVMSEVSTLASEAMSGNFGRMRRSAAALANQAGLLSLAFTSTGAAVLGAAAVIGSFVAAAVMGLENISALNSALESTNDATGLVAGDVLNMADVMEQGNVSFRNARDMLEMLASTGRFTGEQLNYAGQAASAFAEVTGESTAKAATAIAALGVDPAKALDALNEKFGFLSDDQIQALADAKNSGDQYAFLTLTLKDTAEGLQKLADKANDARSPLGKMWDTAITGVSDEWQWEERLLDGELLVKHWADSSSALDKYLGLLNKVYGLHIPLPPTGGFPSPHGRGEDAAKADQTRKDAAHTALGGKGDGSGDSKQIAVDREMMEQEKAFGVSAQQRIKDWKSIADAAVDGSKEQTVAMEQVNEIQKQLNSTSEAAARKSEEAAKKEAEAQKKATEEANKYTMDQLEEKRAAADKGSQEIIAIDQAMVAKAKSLYGEESTEYHRVKMQEIADTKALADAQIAAAKQDASGGYQDKMAQIQSERQANDDLFRSDQINAQQLLALQLNLDAQKIAADRAYYAQLAQLDAGNVKLVKKDNADLTKTLHKDNDVILKDQDALQTHIRAEWKKTADMISQSMGNALKSMLFSGQTFKQDMVQFAEQIAGTFINKGEQMLSKFIEQEIAKTIGKQTQLTAQGTAEDIARTQNAITRAADNAVAGTQAAALAGANGIASFAGAPWPIDIGAPGFGAEMAAYASSYAIASAAGGWERVPIDGMMAQLHKDEMVLPKHVADSVRDGSGGGGAHHYHISAMDQRSFTDFLKRNPSAMAAGMKHMQRTGNVR